LPRKLGQHFLVRQAILERIADAACEGGTPRVIEIGPGRGALTRHLLSRAEELHAIELDDSLASYLELEFRDDPRFHLHRGVLAVGKKPEPVSARDLLASLPERAVVLVLCGIANHDNIGGIYRNAAAFGADAVVLDADCCDPLYRKAIRVSVGAALKIPFASFTDTSGFTAMLAERGFEQFALSPRGNTDIRDARQAQRLALYLGTEGEGLPESLLARLQTVRITMSKGFDSLNVAAASAIALHHFSHR